MGKEIILLAMPGAPPNDFPAAELAELYCMRARITLSNGPERTLYKHRCGKLEAKLREWPRTTENDPSFAASFELAKHLSLSISQEVVLGFIEYSKPDLEMAFEQAVHPDTERVLVVTPMIISPGEFFEESILSAINTARQRFPHVEILYAWPFNMSQLASFLAIHLRQHTTMEIGYAT